MGVYKGEKPRNSFLERLDVDKIRLEMGTSIKGELYNGAKAMNSVQEEDFVEKSIDQMSSTFKKSLIRRIDECNTLKTIIELKKLGGLQLLNDFLAGSTRWINKEIRQKKEAANKYRAIQ